MSNRYKGGIISATPPTTTGGESGTASGAWTLEQQMQAQAAGLWPLQPTGPYIEDVFSTWLYTGNGSTQTINNGIDLAGKGGLVWAKERSNTGTWHQLRDTVRGGGQELYSNDTSGQGTSSAAYTFLSSGYSIGGNDDINLNTKTYASWTFREQPKFFDVVTYTGNGTSQAIAHSLGSVPGCIIVKDITNARAWSVYHTSLGNTQNLILSGTNAAATATDWNNTTPTSTVFTVGNNVRTNASGATYVAYLFAHNAGGFGLSGTDNVISCGSFVANTTVDLGYEPQWVMLKNASGTGGWYMFDNMRGMPTPADAATLFANLSAAEGQQALIAPTSTGFTVSSLPAGNTFIYIAIRRGPMRTPTTGTSVYNAVARTGTGANATVTGLGFSPDLLFAQCRNSAGVATNATDKLRGVTQRLDHTTTNGEVSDPTALISFNMNGVNIGPDGSNGSLNFSAAYTYINWFFGRAPGFFDEVCYTGNDVLRTINHNLGVAPEMMIIKNRDSALDWAVYHAGIGNTKYLFLNSTAAEATASSYWNNTSPTASVFTINTTNKVNSAPSPYVAYLFASCPGVSKVGSYTGTGTTQTINCGFTAGSRFVMIKRTDSTGDWYVWDSARGIVAGDDPYLLFNSAAAEVTNTDFVDTAATGFEISSTAPAAINASGGTFIFLAIS